MKRYAGREACLYVNLYIAGTGLEKRYAGSERAQELAAALFLQVSWEEPTGMDVSAGHCSTARIL